MGGRIGYSAATGIMVILLCWFGTISLMLALIPIVAISADPALHRHADRLAGLPGDAQEPRAGDRPALVPHLAAWGMTQINNALAAAGTIVAALSARSWPISSAR